MKPAKMVDLGSGGWAFHCPGCREGHAFDKSRWKFNGDRARPSFSPSLVHDGPDGKTKCHLFLTSGVITYLSDCTHELAGKSAPFVEFGGEQ